MGAISEPKICDDVALRIGWVAEANDGPHTRLGTARTVPKLTDLGRVQLSKSFFMRDMLYSEVAMIHGLNNAPDDPDLAIKAGKRLCEELLEPLQDHWGRIAIRSAYRSCEVNGFRNAMQRKKKAGYTWAPFVLLLFSRIIYKTRRNPRELALGSFRIVPSVLGGSRHFCGPFAGLCENHIGKRPAHASDRDSASRPQDERQALQGR